MNEGAIWLLAPLFGAVGVYLFLYSRRRRRMLVRFAEAHRLPLQGESAASGIEQTLNRIFSLEAGGLVRSFGQVSSAVVGDGGVQLFRAVELLDLNPHGQSQNTHFSRIAALFEFSGARADAFMLLDRSGGIRSPLPGAEPPDPGVSATIRDVADAHRMRHTLSVSLGHGYGLIYCEPLVTGGETAGDVECLYGVARSLQDELSADR